LAAPEHGGIAAKARRNSGQRKTETIHRKAARGALPRSPHRR